MDKNQKLTKDIDTVSVTYKTTDYKQFNILDGNRNINQAQVSRLIKAVEKKNLLHQNPILVNEKMEIIDGQHRLNVAMALGLPVYYKIEKDSNLEDTILLNANNRKWGTDDYLNSYVKLEKPEYIRLQELKNEYAISTSLAVHIFGGAMGRNHAMDDFRDGKFAITNLEQAEALASTVVELRALCRDESWHDKDAVGAVASLIAKIDPKILLDKMKTHNIFLTRRISTKEYLLQFEEILNYQNNGQVVELV